MAVIQPPDQQAEVILLKELERVDELLLEELERVDEMLQRIFDEIDRLPERIGSASTREVGPVSDSGMSPAEPTLGRASARPFDPYGDDEAEADDDTMPAVDQVVRKLRSWVAAYAPAWEEPGFATLSLSVAMLATVIAVVG
jgi:hypothetical protein